MVTIYQCERCGQITPKGGVICEVVRKCPNCGSRFVVPLLISPRFWYNYLKSFYLSNMNYYGKGI